MDLHSIMNNGTAPEKKRSQASPPPPPAARHHNGPHVVPSVAQNGIPPGVGAPPQPAQHHIPPTSLYDRPGAPIAPPTPSQGRGLAPLHTQGNSGIGGPYPYQQPQPHQQPGQSPINAPPGQSQYRSYEPYSATTPGARPSSHGYPFAHPSPSQYGPNTHGPQSMSQSPTPSSQHSQTPHSVRQSPLTQMVHQPPAYQSAAQHHYQHSQPSTPLGPPPGPPQLPRHSSNQRDGLSPLHQRTISGASNGVVASSPAQHQHQHSIGSQLDSPSRHHRPSPYRRTASDYQSQSEREHSMSVSPKTKIPPRPPSLGSRSSSQHDVPSARSSLQFGGSAAPQTGTPSHMQPPTPAYAQTQYPHPANGVSQALPQTSGSMPASSAVEHSLSTSNNQAPLQHQPQKMDMNHLLAPTQHISHAQNGASIRYDMARHSNEPENMKAQETPHQASQKAEALVKSEPTTRESANTAAFKVPATESPAQHSEPASTIGTSQPSQAKPTLKRPAETEAPAEPPAKRQQLAGRLAERPPWANLERNNPRFGMVPNSSVAQSASRAPMAQTNGNGSSHSAVLSVGEAAWRQQPPLDNGLIRIRSLFPGWERSIIWNTPVPSVVLSVVDWFSDRLRAFSQIGLDPHEGALEIEGKFGTLLLTDTNERCNLPVMSATVITPDYADRKLAFDSQMDVVSPRHVDRFRLNE